MRIYISGISGTGMGPLALFAHDAGYEVCGSDLSKGAIYDELVKAGIEVFIGEQNGDYLRTKLEQGVDWFVYTSALPKEHAELVMAREAGIKCTKRDDLTEFLVEELGLKMVAVAGTHGKTTTTSMIIWAALKSNLKVAYVAGTTLGFAPSGAYHKGDKYFVYEADEYDRNFLKYHPWLAVIPAVSYDHPDIYPSRKDYEEAFLQFEKQSQNVIKNTADGLKDSEGNELFIKPEFFKLAGEARRIDAALATEAIKRIDYQDARDDGILLQYSPFPIVNSINEFPGVGRRFERIADGLYSDYAHHPEEIEATMNVALEEAEMRGKKGVVVLYQPHQNVRQHEVKDGYRDVFKEASKVYWLPTYLVREDSNLPVITPDEFIAGLSNKEVAESAELSDELAESVSKWLSDGYLVVLMTAGPADGWLRGLYGEK